MKNFLRSRDPESKGAALMIVLAFVVFLTGLALTYFYRTTTDKQVLQSSDNDTTADLLARSGLDTVVNDFKQEIINNEIPSAHNTPTATVAPTATATATATATGTPGCKSVVSAQIVSSGNYYRVGDILDPLLGTLCGLADNYGFRLQVTSVDSSGRVTAVTIVAGGIGYSAPPSNPVRFGGSASGSGFTANCTFQ
jgi:Tfp pilus assembly protein PilX